MTAHCGFALLLLFPLMALSDGVAEENADEASRSPSAKPGAFVPLWAKPFDPPLTRLSDRNAGGEFLAVQSTEEGNPWKLLVIDGKGDVRREEILPERTKRLIPPEQACLIACSERRESEIAAGPVEADVRGTDIKVSEGGEHYAVLTRGEGCWYEIAYKNRNGETLQTIIPRDGYGLFDFLVSREGNTIVVVDMNAEGEGDQPKAQGQRVSFYSARGPAGDYDYGADPDTWLDAEKILISKNGRFVAATRGAGSRKGRALVLFDGSGRVLLEKRFFERHYLHGVTNTGEILVSDDDFEKEALLVDKEGNVVGKKDPPISSDILVSDGGRFLLHGRDLIDARSGKTVFRIEPVSVFRDVEIDATGYADAPSEGKPLVFVFGYSACCRKYHSALVNFEEGRVLWRNDKAICRFTDDGKWINCGNSQVYSFE